MPQLYFTMGLPRSGKSTFATEWAKQQPMRAIVNSDTIRLAITNQRYEPSAETLVFATKHIMIKSLLARGFDVMVDGTHSSEISLQRLFEIDINAIPLAFMTDKATCKDRALKTNQPDVCLAIDRIYDNFCKIDFWIEARTAGCPVKVLGTDFAINTTYWYHHIQSIRNKVVKRNLYNEKANYIPTYWWYGYDLNEPSSWMECLTKAVDQNILCFDREAEQNILTPRLIQIMHRVARNNYKVQKSNLKKVFSPHAIDEELKFVDKVVPIEVVPAMTNYFKNDLGGCMAMDDENIILFEYDNKSVLLGSY